MRKLFLVICMSVLAVTMIDARPQVRQQTRTYPTAKVQVETPELDWAHPYNDSIGLRASYLFVPLIFDKVEEVYDTIGCAPYEINKREAKRLEVDDEWLRTSVEEQQRLNNIRYTTMIQYPEIVKYNVKDLPEPPKQYIIKTDPSKATLSIEERVYNTITDKPVEEALKVKRWLHTINGSVQFSQAYISDNWYQGGNNNLNVLGSFLWNVKLNQNIYPKIMFENTIEYKVGLMSAKDDSLRNYSISEDIFQMNTKFGYKAYHNWYYSTTLQFKTQMLNNYTMNTNDLKASFLAPAEMNFGVGMSYSAKSKGGSANFSMSVSPLSLNLKYCRDIERLNPVQFGIEEGKHLHADFGSNIEMKFVWKLSYNVTWTSRLFAFTDYDYIQGDWQNTFNFSINKYLSTQLYAHLRYDDSRPITNNSWKYWQFKEILSFGLNYKFAL